MANRPFPGDPLVDAPIGNTDNVIADSPLNNAGETNNVLSDNPRAGTSNIVRDLDPLSAASGYVPLDGTEPGIVLGLNLNNDLVDVTGNHTMQTVTPTEFTANQTYDGLRHAAKLPGASTGRIYTATGTAHQIPTANPVSYGGMFLVNAVGSAPDNITMLSSSTTTGATNQNYGLRWKVSQTAYQRVPGAVNIVANSGLEIWVHAVVVENAGRTSAKLYLNGALQDTVVPASTGAVLGTNEFWLGELAGAANTSAAGWCSDIFVSNLELNDSQVLAFATNAFGGTPPAAP